jgi:hypothetical protein
MNLEDPHRLPDPRLIPTRRPRSWFEPATCSPADPRQTAESEVDELVVRPFIVTSGRTRPLRDDLRIETLVQAPPAALSAPLARPPMTTRASPIGTPGADAISAADCGRWESRTHGRARVDRGVR